MYVTEQWRELNEILFRKSDKEIAAEVDAVIRASIRMMEDWEDDGFMETEMHFDRALDETVYALEIAESRDKSIYSHVKYSISLGS